MQLIPAPNSGNATTVAGVTPSAIGLVLLAAASAAAARAALAGILQGVARAAASANLTLSGAQTIDGISCVAGDVVLAAYQTTAADRGPWVVAAGAWTRPAWFPAGAVAAGARIYVESGTLLANTDWRCLSLQSASVVGTDGLTWRRMIAGDHVLPPPAASAWTLYGSGSAIADAGKGIVAITDSAAASSTSVSGAEVTIASPAADWTWVSRIAGNGGDHGGGGAPADLVAVREDTGDRIVALYFGFISGTLSEGGRKKTGPTGAWSNLTYYNTVGRSMDQYRWCKLAYVAGTGTLSLYSSLDGLTWRSFGTATKASDLGGNNPNKMIIGLDNISTTGSQSRTILIDHHEVT